MEKNSSTTNTIVKTLMWIIWSFLVMGCFFFDTYLSKKDEITNSFSRDLGVLELSLLIAPFAICMAYRFLLLPKIKNVFVLFPFYVIGLFLSQLIMFFGIFMVSEYLNIFYTLCGIAMLTYMPFLIKLNTPNKEK